MARESMADRIVKKGKLARMLWSYELNVAPLLLDLS
jgi:hypothetical protein